MRWKRDIRLKCRSEPWQRSQFHLNQRMRGRWCEIFDNWCCWWSVELVIFFLKTIYAFEMKFQNHAACASTLTEKDCSCFSNYVEDVRFLIERDSYWLADGLAARPETYGHTTTIFFDPKHLQWSSLLCQAFRFTVFGKKLARKKTRTWCICRCVCNWRRDQNELFLNLLWKLSNTSWYVNYGHSWCDGSFNRAICQKLGITLRVVVPARFRSAMCSVSSPSLSWVSVNFLVFCKILLSLLFCMVTSSKQLRQSTFSRNAVSIAATAFLQFQSDISAPCKRAASRKMKIPTIK